MDKILLYIEDEKRQEEVKRLLSKNGYQKIIFLTQEDTNKYVGEFYSLDIQDVNPKEYQPIKDGEFMVLGNIEEEQVLDILRIFRESGIKRPITCTLTENNCKWKIGELFQDLKLEDQYMKKQFQKKK